MSLKGGTGSSGLLKRSVFSVDGFLYYTAGMVHISPRRALDLVWVFSNPQNAMCWTSGMSRTSHGIDHSVSAMATVRSTLT